MLRSALIPLVVLTLAGCDSPPIQWGDPVEIGGSERVALVVDTGGHVRADSLTAAGSHMPVPAGGCAESMRATMGAHAMRAAWWGLRKDSAAVLYAAGSADSGRTWSAPAVVDSQDVSTRGCDRPPPSVATVGDDLQIAYSMRAPEGTGVFYAHFMGSMLHEAVAVIYGDRLVATAIAADGDRVAVAYEDPNGSRSRVDVALSSTQGHIFEVRTTASRDVDVATAPGVSLAGHEVAVAWSTRRASDSASTRIVRTGRFQ